jgi:hypothetical protein
MALVAKWCRQGGGVVELMTTSVKWCRQGGGVVELMTALVNARQMRGLNRFFSNAGRRVYLDGGMKALYVCHMMRTVFSR